MKPGPEQPGPAERGKTMIYARYYKNKKTGVVLKITDRRIPDLDQWEQTRSNSPEILAMNRKLKKNKKNISKKGKTAPREGVKIKKS